MNVGVAGLGRMGAALAARLLDTGHQVTVWNRSADKAAPLVAPGASVAPTAAALTDAVDIVISILTDPGATDAVYGGLLAGNAAGKLFIDMSTVPSAATVALADKVRVAGAAFVECPVGGSTGPARQGTLIGLMGGEAADIARAKPLLASLCGRLVHCGPVGAGATMKLVVNLPLMVYWQALGEALSLARPLGLDPALIIEVLSESTGGPNALKVRGAGLIKMLNGEDPGPAGFSLDNCTKDLRIMAAEGAAKGHDMPVVRQTLACYEEAQRNGLGAADGSRLSVYWADRPAQK